MKSVRKKRKENRKKISYQIKDKKNVKAWVGGSLFILNIPSLLNKTHI